MDGRGQMNEALAPALRRRTWRHGSNTLSYLHLRVCLGPQSAAWCGCCPDEKIRPYDAAGQAARPRSIRGRLNHLAMAACLGRERPPISCAQGSSRAHGVSERVGWQGRGRGSPCESRLVGLGKVQLEVSVDHLARSYQLQLRRREALRALQPTPECNSTFGIRAVSLKASSPSPLGVCRVPDSLCLAPSEVAEISQFNTDQHRKMLLVLTFDEYVSSTADARLRFPSAKLVSRITRCQYHSLAYRVQLKL